MTCYSIFLLILLMELVNGSLKVSQNIAVKVVNSTFFVACNDPTNSSVIVTWLGPQGNLLNIHTRPQVQTGSNGARILFINTKLEDSGKYICNSSNKEIAEFRLSVEAPLEFMDTPLEQEGQEGNDVTVRCEVRGGSRTWSHDDFNQINDSRIQIIGDGLLVKNASRKDSGYYICKAVQPNTGTIQERRIKLTIEHPPSFPISTKEDHVFGYLNGYINLTCQVEAEPKARFEWLSSSPSKVRKTGNVTEFPNQSILQLRLEKSTFGKYKCKATNKWGKAERIIRLEEGIKPNPPQFLELRGANSNLLDLGIKGPDMRKLNASENMKPIGYRVKYKPRKSDYHHWTEKDFELSEDNSYVLQNLQHDTEYEVTAATRNLAGISEYANISLFTTLTAESDGCFHVYPSFIHHSFLSTFFMIFVSQMRFL